MPVCRQKCLDILMIGKCQTKVKLKDTTSSEVFMAPKVALVLPLKSHIH